MGVELERPSTLPLDDSARPSCSSSPTRSGPSLQAAQNYKDLFELRSAFVHGRAGLHKTSTPARLWTEVLADLLDQGIAYL